MAYAPPLDYEADRRRAAAMRSYVTPALITLGLYCLLWLPGLVANLVYLSAANRDRRLSGVTPEGGGCLFVLLTVCAIAPALLLCGLGGVWVAAALLNGR